MTIEVFLASLGAIGAAAIVIYAMTRQSRSNVSRQTHRQPMPDRDQRDDRRYMNRQR